MCAIMRMEVSYDEAEAIQTISPEFKREALMRASEEGATDNVVCEELDINPRQLRRW